MFKIKQLSRGVAKTCPFCHDGFKPNKRVSECVDCSAIFHNECWSEHPKCMVCHSLQKRLVKLGTDGSLITIQEKKSRKQKKRAAKEAKQQAKRRQRYQNRSTEQRPVQRPEPPFQYSPTLGNPESKLTLREELKPLLSLTIGTVFCGLAGWFFGYLSVHWRDLSASQAGVFKFLSSFFLVAGGFGLLLVVGAITLVIIILCARAIIKQLDF